MTYFVYITEIVSDCQQIYTGVLLIINNHILGLLWGNQFVFQFDSRVRSRVSKTLSNVKISGKSRVRKILSKKEISGKS